MRPAATAERRRQGDELPTGDGQHRADGGVRLVGDAGRLVNEEEAHAEKPRTVASEPGRQTTRLPFSSVSDSADSPSAGTGRPKVL